LHVQLTKKKKKTLTKIGIFSLKSSVYSKAIFIIKNYKASTRCCEQLVLS